jgi:hypothetical protein
MKFNTNKTTTKTPKHLFLFHIDLSSPIYLNE